MRPRSHRYPGIYWIKKLKLPVYLRSALAGAVGLSMLAHGGSLHAEESTTRDDEAMNQCVAALAHLLRSGLTAADYPRAAIDANLQGSLWFVLTCGFDGTFEGSWVERSSGSEVLDRAALRAVERIFPLGDSVPAQCRLGHGFSVTLPLEYRLTTVPARR